jgi:hypothetical protein
MGSRQNRLLYNQNLHIPIQFTTIKHRAPPLFEIHHSHPQTNYKYLNEIKIYKSSCRNLNFTPPHYCCRCHHWILSHLGSRGTQRSCLLPRRCDVSLSVVRHINSHVRNVKYSSILTKPIFM